MLHGVELGQQQVTQPSARGDTNLENPDPDRVGQSPTAMLVNQRLGNDMVSDHRENPLHHYLDFIGDDTNITTIEQIVTPYQPAETAKPKEEIQETVTDQELESRALRTLLPDFDKLLESSSDSKADEEELSDDEDKDANMFRNFDLNEAIKVLEDKEYLSPSVNNNTAPIFAAIPKTVDAFISTASEITPNTSIIDIVPITDTILQQVDNGVSQTAGNSRNTTTTTTTEPSKTEAGHTILRELSEIEDEFISGDVLFESGTDVIQEFEDLSLGSRTPGPQVSSAVNVPFPLMSSQSRDVGSVIRPQTADIRISYPCPEFNRPHLSLLDNSRPVTAAPDFSLPGMNRNINANPGLPPLQSASITSANQTLGSSIYQSQMPHGVRPENPQSHASHMTLLGVPTGDFTQLLLPNQSPEQIHPYSVGTEETTPGLPQYSFRPNTSLSGQESGTPAPRSTQESTNIINPSFQSQPSGLTYDPQSVTSSSSSHGDSSLSPIVRSHDSTSQNLPVGTPNALSGRVSTNPSPDPFPSTSSFQTSTPVWIPEKAKREKDARNEMLKSYQTAQAIGCSQSNELPVSSSQLLPASSSPQRKPLHLNVSSQGQSPQANPVPHVQSAPVISQPPLYIQDHHRVKVPKSATPPKGIDRWPSKSRSSTSASASPSPSAKSQFDQQDIAFGK